VKGGTEKVFFGEIISKTIKGGVDRRRRSFASPFINEKKAKGGEESII